MADPATTQPTQPQVPQGAARANQLINELWNDSAIGPALRAKAKERFPDVVIPEDTMGPIVTPLKEELAATRKALDELKEERAKEKKDAEEKAAQTSLEERLDKARKSYALTDEGFDKMIARMKETGNYYDADAAAAWVAGQTPPPEVPKNTYRPQHLDLFGSKNKDEKYAKLHTDPDGFLDAELNEFVSDPDKYVRETFGQTT